MTKILKLVGQNVKAAIIHMLDDLNENIVTMNDQMEGFPREVETKKRENKWKFSEMKSTMSGKKFPNRFCIVMKAEENIK